MPALFSAVRLRRSPPCSSRLPSLPCHLCRRAPSCRADPVSVQRPGGPMADLSRRDFTRLLALGGSLSFFPTTLLAEHSGKKGVHLEDFGLTDAALPSTPPLPDERFWKDVR